MMFSKLKTAALAGLVGIAALAAAPAQADGVFFGVGDRDARFGIYLGDYSRTHFKLYHHRDDYRYEHRRGELRCTPERALHKARRIGVHRARIDYVNRREIGVVGRSHGGRVHLSFARAPSCPIIR